MVSKTASLTKKAIKGKKVLQNNSQYFIFKSAADLGKNKLEVAIALKPSLLTKRFEMTRLSNFLIKDDKFVLPLHLIGKKTNINSQISVIRMGSVYTVSYPVAKPHYLWICLHIKSRHKLMYIQLTLILSFQAFLFA